MFEKKFKSCLMNQKNPNDEQYSLFYLKKVIEKKQGFLNELRHKLTLINDSILFPSNFQGKKFYISFDQVNLYST